MANMKLEAAFGATTKLLFGKQLSGMARHDSWLSSCLIGWRECGRGERSYPVPSFGAFRFMKDSKSALLSDFGTLAGIKLDMSKPGLHSFAGEFSKKGRFVTDYSIGDNINVEHSTMFQNLAEAYKCLGAYDSKLVAYCSWSDMNEYCFGLYRTFHSKFSMRCYYSTRLSGCFEADSCYNCSGLYFCHNCENVHDSAFCFNANNLRYAIGNEIVGKEAFMEFKGRLQHWLVSRLEEKGGLNVSIFGTGFGNRMKPNKNRLAKK
ncbi:MAG TPA: hypothetical protein PLO51_05565 [Candidatus Micrarchaeota archaeon]|nr:hypothetical protein [Candidatus Micrarchaeota archaeon]